MVFSVVEGCAVDVLEVVFSAVVVWAVVFSAVEGCCSGCFRSSFLC